MGKIDRKNRMNFVMDLLDIPAITLAEVSGVDPSIINKWRRGTRKLTARSKALRDVAAALLELDEEGELSQYYTPYLASEGNRADALTAYLRGRDLPGLKPHTQPVQKPTSGEYTVEHVVYLGKKGFCKAAMAMLDYVLLLPPGQTITVLCQGRYEWFVDNIPFVLQFVAKLKKAMDQGARLRMINRKGYSIADVSAFAGLWLVAHMKGTIRSLYYEGEMPPDIRFVGSIPGYWSARVEEDPTVEDSLYVGLYTDPRETRRDAALCAKYIAISEPKSQYGFFDHPLGEAQEESPRLWKEGPLPGWSGENTPDGSFFAICRVPGIGIATREEARAVAGKDEIPPMPEYLLRDDKSFSAGPHKIILCREDIQEGLAKARRQHEVLSWVLHRRAFVPREMLAGQIHRLLAAMKEREDFEVALVPRTAFRKLQLELVGFKDSVTVGWMQDHSESVFCDDEATAGSFYGYIGHVWNRLQKGWKRKTNVSRTLRLWLAGKQLHTRVPDSNIVRLWDVQPQAKDEEK